MNVTPRTQCCTETRAERRTLIIVLAINAAMFVAEGAAGLISHSTALLADSLDMLADAVVYAIALYAIGRSMLWRARAALTNGLLETLLGIGIVIEALSKMLHADKVPDPLIMGVFGVLALIANTSCFLLLARYRDGDVNLRAVWICARNDMLGNVGVLVASVLVLLTHSFWPDVLIGLLIACVVIKSATGVTAQALRELRRPA